MGGYLGDPGTEGEKEVNCANTWLLGERKDFEVYSCDVSPDGKRLVTAAGGELVQHCTYMGSRFKTELPDSWNALEWFD